MPERISTGSAFAWAIVPWVLACGAEPRTAEGTGEGTLAEADSTMQRAMADTLAWPSYGRDYTNRRFSRLSQINTGNVKELRQAWKYNTGLPYSFENSPIVVGNTMYISTPLNQVVALDARTGQRQWQYVHEHNITVHCCGAVNRGVAVYDDRVYMGALDARLIALDVASGKKLWDVQVADNERGYALNGPVVAIDGKVIIGVSGAEYGIRGFIAAHDARTGKEVWRWYVVPSPEEGGWWGQWREKDAFGVPLNRNIAREKADSAKYADAWQTGGGSVWQAPAIDTERGSVIFTVGNPSPDLDGSVRPGDNLWTNSIIALDYRTGEFRWGYQQIPHDVWDLDTASPVVLVEVDSGGRRIPAVAQAGKHGWVDIVHRETGKPIRRSKNFVPHDNVYALPTREGTRMLPGANGGSEWSPTAVHPELNLMYVLALHQPMLYKVRSEPLKPPAMWLGGAFVGTGEPQYGLFSAVNLNTGDIAWQNKVERPMIGGALATAGGLVFTGLGEQRFVAYDAKSGRQLWNVETRGGVNAPPVTYSIDGTQYVAVAAGGNFQINTPRSDELLVFALGGRASGGQRQQGGQ